MNINFWQLLQVIIIIGLNILSCYFWLRLYAELFKKNAKLKDILMFGLISALGSLGIIRLLGLQNLVGKVSVEEGMKIGSSLLGRKSKQETSLASDYVSFSLLCGVGFGVVENFFYIYYTFGDSLVLAGVSRILTNTLLHALFSGIIGYSIYLYVQKPKVKSIWYIVAGTFIGISLHSFYNRSLTQSLLAISVILIIGGYYLFAYLLYQSDRLFIDNQNDVNGKM